MLISFQAYSRTTYEQILDNKPSINRSYAKRLAQEFDRAADKYKVPANVLAGIAMAESSYVLNAVNKGSNDYGIMQVNNYNIRAYKLDKARLLTDLSYSIDSGAMIFQWFYKTYREISVVIRRYNCGVKKSCITWKGPRFYYKKVLYYM